jgi:hypothetical protein
MVSKNNSIIQSIKIEAKNGDSRIIWMDITDDHTPFIIFKPYPKKLMSHEVPIELILNRIVELSEDEYGNNETITILGGFRPEIFDVMLKFAEMATPSKRDLALVERGLAFPRSKTREVACDMLRAKGVTAMPALVRGLKSPDAQIKYDCGRLLTDLRDATIDGRYEGYP